MTKLQREALTALRDVMIEHRIVFNSCNEHSEEYDLTVGGVEVNYSYMRLDWVGLADALSEPNDSKRVAGRDFTGTGGDL